MTKNLKERSFKFIYWSMLFLLVGDTADTVYRFVFVGYLGDGSIFPEAENIVKPTSVDLFIFLFFQFFSLYGVYLLYKLKKSGGYCFFISQLFFLIYATAFGPIAEIGLFNIILPIILFFCLYFFLTIVIPWYYSEKFS